jgi:hypothetical protein
MSSTFSNLKFELIGNGEQSGTWGSTTNTNIGTAIEQAIVGMATLDSGDFSTNVCTLTLSNTNAAQDARALCLNIASGAVSAAGTVNVPAIEKPYIIINGSSFTVTVKVSGQTGVAVPAGKRTVVYNNGTDVGSQINWLAALDAATATLSGNLTLNGGTANGVAYLNGSKVLTTGSALTFDGTNTFGVNSASATTIAIDSSGGNLFRGVSFRANGAEFGFDRTNSATGEYRHAIGPSSGWGGFHTYYVDGAEQMRLTSTGLGIGTSSPTAKLDVVGITQSRGNIYGGTTNANANIIAFSSVANGGAGSSQFLFGNASTDTRGYLSYIHANDSLLIGTTGTTKATLDSSGNLGLGVTPSAWQTSNSVRALQFNAGNIWSFSTVSFFMSQNAFFNSSNQRQYITSAAATEYEQVAGAHKWFTAPSGTAGNAITFTQAMTLHASGNLLVGTTVASVTSGLGFKFIWGGSGTDPYMGIVTDQSTNSNANYHLYSTGAGAYRFYVGNGGTVYATSTTISAISDQRLKENVQDLDVGLDKIMALKPRKFDWKEGKGKDIKGDRGWIAQEFEQVFPDMIDQWKDAAPDGEEPYKSVRADLIPVLVKAIQELKAEFDAYKSTHP